MRCILSLIILLILTLHVACYGAWCMVLCFVFCGIRGFFQVRRFLAARPELFATDAATLAKNFENQEAFSIQCSVSRSAFSILHQLPVTSYQLKVTMLPHHIANIQFTNSNSNVSRFKTQDHLPCNQLSVARCTSTCLHSTPPHPAFEEWDV